MELKPFDDASAERLANDATGGMLDALAAKRWARRGSYTPLGILEALALGLASGELSWNGAAYSASRRTEGRGRPLPARDWIAKRAQTMTSPIEQVIVAIVAFVGGEARLDRVQRVLAAANVEVDAAQEAAKLVARRWLVEPQRGWVALPTRSHREAILGAMRDESLRNLIHLAIGHVLAQEERGLGLAEAAHHLARGGDAPLAAQVALTAARVAMSLELSAGAAQLLTFAREKDPSVVEDARAEVAHGLPPPPPARTTTLPSMPRVEVPPPHDSEPPTVAVLRQEADSTTLAAAAPVVDGDATAPHTRPPVSTNTAPLASSPSWGSALRESSTLPPQTPGRPPPVSSHRGRDSTVQPPETTSDPPHGSAPPISDVGGNVGQRLSELAKEALLGADTRALERWTEGLRATGDRGRFAERMQAIVRLARGDVGEALRVLRAARAELDASASAAQRCQASLALGFALAVAHRPDEALLEALDALSRARESGDEKGAHACLAFLAKLYASVERGDDAARLRKFAKIAEDRGPPLEEVPM
jgi:hypothetical protein